MHPLQEAAIIQEVLRIRKDLPRVGTEKLYFLLADFLTAHQIKLGRDKLRVLLRTHNLTVKRKKSRVVTTFSGHSWYTYPNLIKNLVVTAPNQVWVSDLTYIHLNNGFNYLSLITDAYSRKIVGWSLQKNMHAKGPIKALEMAVKELEGRKYTLIHRTCDDVCIGSFLTEADNIVLIPISNYLKTTIYKLVCLPKQIPMRTR